MARLLTLNYGGKRLNMFRMRRSRCRGESLDQFDTAKESLEAVCSVATHEQGLANLGVELLKATKLLLGLTKSTADLHSNLCQGNNKSCDQLVNV